jgi:hypothetical protein
VLVVAAVVVEVLIAGVVVVVIADCSGWRSEAFLGFFSVYEGILEGLFNSKYRPTASDVSANIFMIIEL